MTTTTPRNDQPQAQSGVQNAPAESRAIPPSQTWLALKVGLLEVLAEQGANMTGWLERYGHLALLADAGHQVLDAHNRLVAQVEALRCPYPEPRVEVPGQTALEDHLSQD